MIPIYLILDASISINSLIEILIRSIIKIYNHSKLTKLLKSYYYKNYIDKIIL